MLAQHRERKSPMILTLRKRMLATLRLAIVLAVPGALATCYSREGLGGDGFAVTPRAVTQDFEGAEDLDILPALVDKPVTVGRVWSKDNDTVKAVLTPDTADWTAATSIALDILAPDGSVSATSTFKLDTPAGTPLQTTAQQAGFYTFRVTAANTPATNRNPSYTLSAMYTGQTLFQPIRQAEAQSVGGVWGPLFPMSNVAIHAHLLHTGKVLYWGRRSKPGDTTFASLNEHECHPFLWDPATKTSTPTPQP